MRVEQIGLPERDESPVGTDNKPITEHDALGWLPHTCFRTGPPRRTGLELELLVTTGGPIDDHVPAADHAALLADLQALPLRSRLTVEPGGPIELSGPPADDVVGAVDDLDPDLTLVRSRVARHGLRILGAGLDPRRAPRRMLHEPRYSAMEAYYDRRGLPGRTMMCSTASLQVNVEAGAGGDDVPRRWQLLHAVGPSLVAAFANSPLRLGRPSGWASTRQAVWRALDARRNHAVRPRPDEPLPEAYARWCLDAPLMLVRRPQTVHDQDWSAPAGMSFRDWVRHGERAVPGRAAPTLDDLVYHQSTLFPPVRARGHLEVRYLDAQPGDSWQVPAAVVTALVQDPGVGDLALDACRATGTLWREAARSGVHHPDLRASATRVLALAAEALRAHERTAGLAEQVEEFLVRYPLRGRHPGDDLLDAFYGEALVEAGPR